MFNTSASSQNIPIGEHKRTTRPSHMFEKLKSASTKLKIEIKVYKLVQKDKRTPKIAKFLLCLAIGYTLLPLDIIPDFIPVIGHLDDVIIVPVLVILALKMIPKEVIDDCRARVLASQ